MKKILQKVDRKRNIRIRRRVVELMRVTAEFSSCRARRRRW